MEYLDTDTMVNTMVDAYRGMQVCNIAYLMFVDENSILKYLDSN